MEKMNEGKYNGNSICARLILFFYMFFHFVIRYTNVFVSILFSIVFLVWTLPQILVPFSIIDLAFSRFFKLSRYFP